MSHARVILPGLVWVQAAAAAAGCGNGSEPPQASSVRDSAAVHIVESAGAAWGPGEEWRVDPEPQLDIGSADGDEPYLFDYVETALRLADGRIVVANASTGELRFFDPAGRHLRSVGRRGGGPGEFGMSSVHIWRSPAGDLVAEDAGNRRVNVFDSTGTLRATVPLATPPAGARPSIRDVLADGGWLVQSGDGGTPDADGAVQERVQYHRYEADGRHTAQLTDVVGSAYRVVPSGRATYWLGLPFSAAPFAAAHGDDVLLNAGGAARLDRLDGAGRLLASYRWAAPRRRSADLFDAYRRDQLSGGDSTWRQLQESYLTRALPMPELAPAYVRMVVDHAGHVWLQRHYLDSESERLNDVLAPDGRWLGTVSLPPGGWLLQAGPDFVLLWRRDDLGVEHVSLHGLRRSPADQR